MSPSSSQLVGLARQAEKVTGTAVGACDARWLAVTTDRTKRARFLAVVERGICPRIPKTDYTGQVRRFALAKLELRPGKIFTSRRRRIGGMLDGAIGMRIGLDGIGHVAPDVARRRLKDLVVGVVGIGLSDCRNGDGRRGRRRGDQRGLGELHGRLGARQGLMFTFSFLRPV